MVEKLIDRGTVEQIDAGARYLRETLQGGRKLTPWETTAKATKKKWQALAEGVLLAMTKEASRHD